MKNFKKILSCIMVVATLGSITCIPISAIDDTFPIVSTSTDNAINPIEYVKQTFESNVEEYLHTTGIDEKIKNTPTIDKTDNFTSKYNFCYYANPDNYYSIASFEAYIRSEIYFESSNPNLTINDVLTSEQIEEIENLQGSISKQLTNEGTDTNTGLTTYYLYLYLPYSNMSYNDTVKYKYNLGKSLVDSGIVDNAYLNGFAKYDDYNGKSIYGDFIIVMNDNTELTNDILGEYADSIQSFEKVTCDDGTTINGATEYYTFTKSQDTEYSYDEICLKLRNNDNIKFAGCLAIGYESTELWQGGKDINFKIPILSNNQIIGDSEKSPITEITVGESTYPRGDINLDGKVNSLDLLMLKKYLLGLMEW